MAKTLYPDPVHRPRYSRTVLDEADFVALINGEEVVSDEGARIILADIGLEQMVLLVARALGRRSREKAR